MTAMAPPAAGHPRRRHDVTPTDVRAEIESRLRILESRLRSQVRTPAELVTERDPRDEMADVLVRLRSLEQRYRVQERR